MPNADPEAAAREYATLLLKLHQLDPRGENESAELDAICDQMDGPSRRQGVAMAPDENVRWAEQGKAALASGDPDANLQHLR